MADLNKTLFYSRQQSFVYTLNSILQRIYPGAQARITSQTEATSPPTLTVTIAALNQSGVPLLTTSILSALADYALLPCSTPQEYACACSNVTGGFSVDGAGCFAINSLKYCVPNNSLSCLTTIPTTNFSNTSFPVNSSLLLDPNAVIVHCPSAPQCVARAFGVSSASYFAAASTTTLSIPSLPPAVVYTQSFPMPLSVDRLHTLAQFWRNCIQPKPFPIEYADAYLSSNSSQSKPAADSYATDSYVIPFYVMLGFSLCFLVLTPLISCIVCCSRCCKCCKCHAACGGPLHHENPSEKNRQLLLVSAVALLVLIACCLYGFWDAETFVGTGLTSASNGVDAAIDTIDSYKNKTLDQAQNIAVSLIPAMETAILAILDSFSSGIGIQIQNVILPRATALMAELESLATIADVAYNTTVQLSDATDTLSTNLNTLDTSVTQLVDDTTTLGSDCNDVATAMGGLDQAVLQSLCPAYSINVPVTFTLAGAPSFFPVLLTLQVIKNADLHGMVQTAHTTFDDIPVTIGNIMSDAQDQVETKLADFQQSILDQTTDARARVDDQVYNNINLSKYKDKVKDYTTSSSASEYDTYRHLVSIVILCGFSVTCGFIFLAIMIGMCSYDKYAAPWERSNNSASAASLLKFCIFLLIVFVIIANVVVFIMFLTTSGAGKACDMMYSDAQWTKLIDNPNNWEGENPLAKAALDNGYLPLTALSFMTACRNNQGIWSALQLDYRKNLSSFVDVNSFVNVSSIMTSANFNLDSTNVIPMSSLTYVDVFITGGLTTYDFATYFAMLNTPATSTNINDLVANLTQLQDALIAFNASASSHPQGLEDLIANTTLLIANVQGLAPQLQTIDDERIELITLLLSLQNLVTNATVSVPQFTADVLSFNTFFWTEAQTILNPAPQVDLIVSAMSSFATQTAQIIRTQLGNCLPLVNAYTTMLDSTCGVTVNGLDAYWFSLASICFLSCFLLFVLLKLIKHFRINEETDTGRMSRQYNNALPPMIMYAEEGGHFGKPPLEPRKDDKPPGAKNMRYMPMGNVNHRNEGNTAYNFYAEEIDNNNNIKNMHPWDY